jgi:hypothetical protein
MRSNTIERNPALERCNQVWRMYRIIESFLKLINGE